MTKSKDHPEVKHGKQGVLLVNLGTPDSLKLWDIRKYLAEQNKCKGTDCKHVGEFGPNNKKLIRKTGFCIYYFFIT